MTTPVIRLGACCFVSANLIACSSWAQNPLPNTVSASVSDARTVTAKIVLTEDVVQLLAKEKPDLGVVQAGEVLKVEFDVVNGTGHELVFDRIVSQTDQARPNKGRIQAGESMKVSFLLHTSPRPRSQETGNFIEFHCNNGKAGYVNYGYSFATYVGVADNLVTIQLQDSAPVTQARFDVPIVIGGMLKEGDFEVSMEGIDGEFDARVDADAKLLHCLFKFAEPLETDRSQGKLVILDLASGFIRETPIVFERQKQVEILPAYLEFVPDEDGEGYFAVLYVRQISPDPESNFGCAIESSVSEIAIESRVSQLQHDLVRCRLRISKHDLERIGEIASQTDAASQPSVQHKLGINITTNDSKLTTALPFSIRGQSAIQAGPIDKLFVTDAIRTGMLAMLSLSPFDVYGVTTEEKEFEDEPRHVTERVRFRLRFDRENQLFVYAAETKPDRMAVLRGDDSSESVRYGRLMINGNRLHDSDSPHPRTVESFEQALEKAPQPAYWGASRFPGSSSTPSHIEHLAVNAGRSDSNVTVSAVQGGLRVTLRTEEPRAGISIWEYGLPEFKPTRYENQQIIDGSPSRLFEQTIVWDTVRGHEVPIMVTLESVAIKRLEAKQPTYAIGKEFKDTQLAWLSFDSGNSESANQNISIHSPKEIKDYIEEGEQKAKSLGQ